jgi:hypothetical protein
MDAETLNKNAEEDKNKANAMINKNSSLRRLSIRAPPPPPTPLKNRTKKSRELKSTP